MICNIFFGSYCGTLESEAIQKEYIFAKSWFRISFFPTFLGNQRIHGLVSFNFYVFFFLVSPKIISKAKFEAHINKDVILLCNTSANPPAAISWEFFKSFEPITLKEGKKHEKYSVLPTENIETGNNYYSSSQLYIEKIQNEELGIYICVATNIVGFDKKNIEVVGYCK